MAPKPSLSRSASSKSSSSSSSSKKNKKSSSLQQSTLSFSKGKQQQQRQQPKKGAAAARKSSSSKATAVEILSSDDDEEEEEPKEHLAQQDVELELELQLQDEEEEEEVEVKELDVRGKEWTSGYVEAKKMMGKVDPIHAEDQTKVDTILRIFDLDFRFGPCTSLSRIDRWNRAERLGLEPPSYVKDILLTRQGMADSKLKESVFYGAV